MQFPRGHVLDMLGQWPPSRPETPAPEPPPRPSSRVGMRTGFESVLADQPPRPPSRGPTAPPPPPARTTYPANTVREDNTDIAQHLNRASIQHLTEQADESKEQIVEEWVRQTTQQYNTHQQEMITSEQQEMTMSSSTKNIKTDNEITKNLELEKFAQDVAETVVTNMEKNGALPGAAAPTTIQDKVL